MMINIKSPHKYIQGPDVLSSMGSIVKPFGSNFLILTVDFLWDMFKDSIHSGFEAAGIGYAVEFFEGECTYEAMEKVAGRLKQGGFDGLIAMGGGKALDTGKGAAFRAGISPIIVPTIASSDAPCSGVAVIYTADGQPNGIEGYPCNPLMVLVDSTVIAKAPVSSLVAGMGDALATFFEARVRFENGFPRRDGSRLALSAYTSAKLCHEMLMKYGREAKAAVERRIANDALEQIIEANTYLSGFGFENCGLSSAHGIQDALMTLPECSLLLHGQVVSFGALCLLVLDERPQAEIDEVLAFCRDVGLPITLAQLGLTENAEAKIRSILPKACDPNNQVFRLPPNSSEEKMFAAILTADKLGRECLADIIP